MDTISNIRRRIYRSEIDHIFTTREFLACGLRAAVDKALSRLVTSGLIVRIARGMFIKEGAPMPSIEKVAMRKAEAFGKMAWKHCADVAKELKLVAHGNKEITFAVNGCSSSFCFGNKRIYFKSIGARKVKLGNSTTGEAMRAFWHMGWRGFRPEKIMAATLHFNRPDREAIKSATAFMPAWLTNNFAWRWC